MEKGPRKIRWKLLLVLAVVVAIVGLMIYPDPSNFPFSPSLELPRMDFDAEWIASDLSSILSPIPQSELSFVMTSESNQLEGQSFDVQNAHVSMMGLFTGNVNFGDTAYMASNRPGDLELDNFSGTIEFFSGNRMMITGTASSAILDGTSIVSRTGSLKISTEMAPSRFSVDPVKVSRIVLDSFFGTLERGGEERTTVDLSGSTLEIREFEGNLKLDGLYIISGLARQVKGKTFSWTGQ